MCLEKEPEKRATLKEIKEHKFFEIIDWDAVYMERPPKGEPLTFKNEETRKRSQTTTLIKEGIVEKKSPWWHYNTRLIKLFSTPKIEYIEPDTNKVKGVILLSQDCEAIFKSRTVFHVKTPKRTFEFKVNS